MKRPVRYYFDCAARWVGIAVIAGLGAYVVVMAAQRIANGGAW